MKKIFTLIVMALTAVSVNAEKLDLTLDDLGSGWSSSYDAATKTITYEGAWTGRGWWLGGVDYTAYNKAVVEFDKQDLGIRLVVQYYGEGTETINEDLNSSTDVDAGITRIEVGLREGDKARVAQIYLQSHAEGTVVLKEAYVTDEGSTPDTPVATDGVLWEGTALVNGWSDQPTFLSDGGKELKDAGAEAGDYIYFYGSAPDDNWQVELTEGHWGGMYARYSGHEVTDTDGSPRESIIVDLATQGYFAFQLTQEVLDKAFTVNWWGGVFLLNGDGNLTITKVVLVKGSAAPVEAKTLFLWEGGEEEAAVSGGTVVSNGDNNALSASLITVSAKKANIANDNVTITLDEALLADDVIAITGYRKKDSDANGNLYIEFENGTVIDEGDEVVWNNIHENVGQQPNTNTYTVGEGAGSKVIKLARSKASTNVFITKIVITRGGATGVQTVKTVIVDNGIIYNLAGQRVDANYKGVVIKNGKKFFQK